MKKDPEYSRIKSMIWKFLERRRTKCHYTFKDRSKGQNKMAMVLAGYKEYLYEPVFRRFKQNLTPDIDVCIITSGKFVPEIDAMCEKEGWSYLSTKENHVSLVQNVAILLHPNAQYIYKMDEDIFLCSDFFDRLMKAYEHAKEGQYYPGVMAPLININGYGYVRLLEKLGLTETYTKMFGKPMYAGGPENIIETSAEVARFFWGEGGYFPSIDEIDRKLAEEPLEERPCPVRFSIGAILFERSLWERMHYFSVRLKHRVELGLDEEDLCAFCINSSLPIMVSENLVVGHFSFGPQNAAMREYFDSHKDIW